MSSIDLYGYGIADSPALAVDDIITVNIMLGIIFLRAPQQNSDLMKTTAIYNVPPVITTFQGTRSNTGNGLLIKLA